MRIKNHIKADNDSLRGIGKLGYGEGSKLHKTVKKLTSTFEEEVPAHSNKSSKPKVQCPACRSRIVADKNGKPRRHTSRFTNTVCDGKLLGYKPAEIIKQVSEVTIQETTFKPTDKVIYTPFYYHTQVFEGKSILDLTIEKLYLMDNNKIYIKFKEYGFLCPDHYFVKNIIKQ